MIGNSSPCADSPSRELPALAEKVLIIGLDGCTFDVLEPMMQAGRMPHLARIIEEGTSGILDSTKPPMTPAAWSTFMTGKSPGRHGIIDFERYDPLRHELRFNSTQQIGEPTIWRILSEKGLRVGSINVPMTYPPPPVNGFLISGFETPSTDVDFTYPKDLKGEILRRFPDYSYRTRWRRKAFGGDDVFAQNLDYISRSFDQGLELTRFCGEKYGWDVLMVLYKLTDNLQHKAWKYFDPRTAPAHPKRAEMAAEVWRRLDHVLGQLAEYAASHNAHILMMSDHGHGSLEGKAQANLILKRLGYLELQSPARRMKTRLEHFVRRQRTKGRGRFAAGHGLEHDLAVDWTRTQACVMHAGIYGFLYLSLQGRQPNGIVPPQHYEALRDRIKADLEAATSTDRYGRSIRIFPEVHKPEELYGCRREDSPWMPDLLLAPAPGLSVVRKIRGRRPVKWSRLQRMEGTHRVEGIFVAHGPGVRPGARVRHPIADVAPTLLAMLGLRVPQDMEGQVMEDMFCVPPTVAFESPISYKAGGSDEEVFSERELAVVTQRLSELGYLE